MNRQINYFENKTAIKTKLKRGYQINHFLYYGCLLLGASADCGRPSALFSAILFSAVGAA